MSAAMWSIVLSVESALNLPWTQRIIDRNPKNRFPAVKEFGKMYILLAWWTFSQSDCSGFWLELIF